MAFARAAHPGAVVDGQPRWMRAMAVVNLLPSVLPGIKVTHEERQVALLRDVLRGSATENNLIEAGFSPSVVASVVRLTRFDAGFSYLEHLTVVASSSDLAAKRVAMAVLLLEEQRAAEADLPEPEERRRRRSKAMEMLRRGLGY
jgi:(p)ppGpp synthase/HD superfamily hydrolase